jgi:hypothetical protein
MAGVCPRLGRRLRPRPLAYGRCRARRPTPGGPPRYRQADGDPPSRSIRHRAMRKPRGGPSSVPGIVSPRTIAVKGAPAARRLLRSRKPLSSDRARQVHRHLSEGRGTLSTVVRLLVTAAACRHTEHHGALSGLRSSIASKMAAPGSRSADYYDWWVDIDYWTDCWIYYRRLRGHSFNIVTYYCRQSLPYEQSQYHRRLGILSSKQTTIAKRFEHWPC